MAIAEEIVPKNPQVEIEITFSEVRKWARTGRSDNIRTRSIDFLKCSISSSLLTIKMDLYSNHKLTYLHYWYLILKVISYRLQNVPCLIHPNQLLERKLYLLFGSSKVYYQISLFF